jgi:polyhydroxybutyrate depolymerase
MLPSTLLSRLRALQIFLAFAICFPAWSGAQQAKTPPTGHSAKQTLAVAGLQRSYLLYRPAGLAATSPVPLVVMLHGRYDSDDYAEKAYHWDEVADAHGFVVVYPDGYHRMWNAGHCCGRAQKDNIDDVGFLSELIRQVTKSQNIDPKRVYIAGMSMGALMAYRMACESPVELAAIGGVSGDLVFECPAPHATSVIEIHGGKDHLLPLNGKYDASDPKYIPSVNDTVSKWRVVDRCGDVHETVSDQVSDKLNQCDAGRAVELIVIADAGHQWPEGKRHIAVLNKLIHLDQPSGRLDATERLWAFFAAHPAPSISAANVTQ